MNQRAIDKAIAALPTGATDPHRYGHIADVERALADRLASGPDPVSEKAAHDALRGRPRILPVHGTLASLAFPHVAVKIADHAALHAAIAATGIKLAADGPGDTVHGHVSTSSREKGDAFTCGLCGNDFAKDVPHYCVEVVLYEEDEAPNEHHASVFQAHGLDAAGRARLHSIVQAHKP